MGDNILGCDCSPTTLKLGHNALIFRATYNYFRAFPPTINGLYGTDGRLSEGRLGASYELFSGDLGA